MNMEANTTTSISTGTSFSLDGYKARTTHKLPYDAEDRTSRQSLDWPSGVCYPTYRETSLLVVSIQPTKRFQAMNA